MTTIQRSLNKLRADGWTAGNVQIFLHKVKIYRDLFGLADIAAVKDGVLGTLYVQACTDSTFAAHVEAAFAHRNLAKLLGGNKFEVWGWGLKGKRGKRKLWALRRVVFIMTHDGPTSYEA